VIISVVSVVHCVLCGVSHEMCMHRLSVCTDCLLIVLSFMCLVGGVLDGDGRLFYSVCLGVGGGVGIYLCQCGETTQSFSSTLN